MQLKSWMIVLGLIHSAAMMSACGSRNIDGEIKVAEGQRLELIDSANEPFEVKSGPTSIDLTWALGFDNEMHVRTAGRFIRIPVTRESILSDQAFYVRSATSGQPVDLYARKSYERLSTHEEVRYEYCTAPGYCYHYGDRNHRGGYYWDSFCPGNRAAAYAVTYSREFFLLQALPAGTGTDAPVLATFEGKSQAYPSSTRFLGYRSSCMIH